MSLDGLRRKYGKILILADGAVPHRSKATMDYLARHHGDGGSAQVPGGRPAHKRRQGDMAQIKA